MTARLIVVYSLIGGAAIVAYAHYVAHAAY